MVMLELPSPPFQNEYGEYEPILYFAAKRRNTHLIPRHRFLFVFVARYATLDTIYLSQARHFGCPIGCGVWFAGHFILIPSNS